jgi:hypothetical protein
MKMYSYFTVSKECLTIPFGQSLYSGNKKRCGACNIAISVTRSYGAFIMKFSNFLPLVMG